MAAFAPSYRKALCEAAHQLLFWGYQISRPRINCDTHEDTITQYLVDGMWEKKRDPSTDEKYDDFIPHEQRPLSGGSRTGRDRLKVDIEFQWKNKPFPIFTLEAKCLKANEHPIGVYTGVEGMGCFVDERYSENEPDAAMVGYVQSHDMSRWFDQLQNSLAAMPCQVPLTPIIVLPEIEHEHFSVHRRPTKGDITIYHIFLDFR